MSRTKIYRAWENILRGGKRIPDSWNTFDGFRAAVGDPPCSTAMLRKADRYRGYENNLRWVIPKATGIVAEEREMNIDLSVNIERMKAHVAADELVRGVGFADGRGCFVGCTWNEYNHAHAAELSGVPEWVWHLCDTLHENVTVDLGENAMRLLNLMHGMNPEQFAPIRNEINLFMLRRNRERVECDDLPESLRDEVLDAIDMCITCHADELRGVILPDSRWSAAESAARSAESAAAESAESAAWSAAESAVWSAARSAESARSARSAAESAARSAAWSAAWSEARSAEAARSVRSARSAEYDAILAEFIRLHEARK